MKKPYVPVPESELTEEEVRRGFNRLRELYQDANSRIHNMKVERGKLRVEIEKLNREIRVLTKENNKLKRENEKTTVKIDKPKKKSESDFKKKFFDSL